MKKFRSGRAAEYIVLSILDDDRYLIYTERRKVVRPNEFIVKVLLLPLVLVSAFLALMLRWTLNLSAFIPCAADAIYFRLWALYAVLPGVDAVLDPAGD